MKASLASAARKLFTERRLRLSALPAPTRALARLSLLALAVSATLLVLTPLATELPGGSIELLRSDAPPIGRLPLLMALLGIAVAFAALAVAASRPGWRLGRLTLIGLALAGVALVPHGGELGPVASPVATPATFVGVASALALVVLALVPRPIIPWVAGPLAALPPLAAAAAVLGSRLSPVADGFERLVATETVLGITAIEGLFMVLALWAVIEFSRALTATSTRAFALPRGGGSVLAASLVLKVALIAFLSFVSLPKDLRPEFTPVEAIALESPISLGIAVLLAAAAGWWLLKRPGGRLSAGGATAAAWLVTVPLLIPFILPPIAQAVRSTVVRFIGPGADPEELRAGGEVILTVQDVLLAIGPAAAAYLALVAGSVLLARRRSRHRGAAFFLLGYAAWTVVPATAWLLTELFDVPASEGQGGLLGNVNPMTLDLTVTLVVAVLAVLWWSRRQERAGPGTLVAVLLVSTVMAYGDVAFAGGLGVIVFWLGLAFPLVVQFLFDAEPLNRPGPDREARVLGALGIGVLASSFTIPMVALGFIGPESVGFSALGRVLLFVPFTAVLLAAMIQSQDSRAADSADGSAPVALAPTPRAEAEAASTTP